MINIAKELEGELNIVIVKELEDIVKELERVAKKLEGERQ